MQPFKLLSRTQLALLATRIVLAGVVMLLLGHYGPAWVPKWLFSDLGVAFVGSGLIAFYLERGLREAARAEDLNLLDRLLTRKAPAFRDAVIQGFAFDAADLKRVASAETLDQIARNVLALQLGDRQLAEDVHADTKEQIIRSGERWYGLDLVAELSPWEGGPSTGPDAMFAATIRREYRVAAPSPTMRFACVSDMEAYRDLLEDPASTFAWYFRPAAGLTGASKEAFELLQFTVDGKPRTIRRAERSKGQIFTVNTGMKPHDESREVTISYTYRVLVRRVGHLLWLDVAKPAKGLKIELRYGDCGISQINTVNFIASAQPTRIAESPSTAPTRSVEVSFDGWVFPKSGVAFVWVLEDEVRGGR